MTTNKVAQPPLRLANAETERADQLAAQLADALEVIEKASKIFYVDGRGDTPNDILTEALAAAAQDFWTFMSLSSSSDTPAEWQDFERAEARCNLALAVAKFREKHPKAKQTAGDES
jgi:hypothetical protein